jgi:hypothetical protein
MTKEKEAPGAGIEDCDLSDALSLLGSGYAGWRRADWSDHEGRFWLRLVAPDGRSAQEQTHVPNPCEAPGLHRRLIAGRLLERLGAPVIPPDDPAVPIPCDDGVVFSSDHQRRVIACDMERRRIVVDGPQLTDRERARARSGWVIEVTGNH